MGAVARSGVDPDELVDGGLVDPGLLADGRARISLLAWHSMLRRAITLTGDPGLGLKLGGEVPEHVLQIVGQLAVSCGTLRDAMAIFQRYRVLLGNTLHFDLVEEGELAYFVCTPLVTPREAPYFDTEMALSFMYRVGRRFAVLGSEDAEEIWLTYPAPEHAARYAEVFNCPVRFARSKNAILVQRRYLDMRQPYADARTHEILREGAERLLNEQGAPSLPDRVRALLRQESNLCQVDAHHIARVLRLHPRTFKRRLIQANAPWSSLLDETRRQVACDELRHSGASLRAVSERLGFSDQSAFNRAFKRWTGKTPTEYSRAAGSGGSNGA